MGRTCGKSKIWRRVFTWGAEDFDGNSLEEGNYSFTLEGTTSDGTQVEINEIMVGVVDGMSYLEGIPTFYF